jgi:hypothetical protein
LPAAIPNLVDLNVAQEMEHEVLLDLNVPASMDIELSDAQLNEEFREEVDQVPDAVLEPMVVPVLPVQQDEHVNFLHLEIQPNELNAYLPSGEDVYIAGGVGETIQAAQANVDVVSLEHITS